MRLIVINPKGIKIYEKPNIGANIITQEPPGYIFSRYFSVSDSEWYEVTTPVYTGYIREPDIDFIDDQKPKILTEIEEKYLIHLLEYADEELYVYSANYLGRFGIKLEEVTDFINDLKTKIQKGDEQHESCSNK